MSGEFTDVAKSWLLDPAWQKVFKHTVDVFEDYVSYILVSYSARSQVLFIDKIDSLFDFIEFCRWHVELCVCPYDY